MKPITNISSYLILIFALNIMAIPTLVFADIEEADALKSSVRISTSGMNAQNQRLKVAAQNIANINVTGRIPEEDPYRRKVIFFKNEFDPKLKTDIVKVDKISYDYSPFIKKYQPNHPAADEQGMVKYPNVNILVETVDTKEAQRTFEANINALEIAKANQFKILELMR